MLHVLKPLDYQGVSKFLERHGDVKWGFRAQNRAQNGFKNRLKILISLSISSYFFVHIFVHIFSEMTREYNWVRNHCLE